MTDSGSKAPVTRGHKGRFGLPALMTALSLMLTLGLAACDDDTPEAATTSDLSNLDAATIVTAQEQVFAGIYESVLPSVVRIRVRRAAQQSPDGVPNGSIIEEGSGFVWSKAGYIVTNDHIVSNATQVLVIFSDRTEVAAEVVGTDPHSDLAVLRVDMLEDRLHPVTVGDSDALKVGQVTLADLSLRPAAIGGSGAMGNAPGSLPLNDETDYGLCFACGPRNRSGLHLRFQRDGGTVTTSFQGREEHQGFPGYVHGGVITALLDEIMSRVSLLEDRWTITARMEVRFRRPVMLDQRVTAVAEKSDERRGFIEATGRVVLPDGSDAAVASGTFAFLSRESLAKMSAGHPGLASQWMR